MTSLAPPARPATFSSGVVGSLDDLTEADWQRVGAGRGLYCSRRWLRALEDDPWHDVWYVTVRDDAAALRAVLPLYLPSGTSRSGVDAFYDPGALFFGGSTAWSPTLLAGTRSGYDTELLVDGSLLPAERTAVLAELVRRWEALAAAFGVPARAVLYLVPSAAAELAPLLGATPLLTDVTAVLPLSGLGGMEDHLARLGGHRRGRVRRELRDFAASGLTLRWAGLPETVEVVAGLLAGHHSRYGHRDTVDDLVWFLRGQADALGDISRVLLCERGREVVGALLVHEWEGVWYGRFAAAGSGLRGEAFAYFSLAFYGPLVAAVEAGASAYVLGPSSLGAKLARGAVPEGRWSLLAGPEASGSAGLAVAQTWNAAAAARWSAELPGLPGAVLALP